VRKQVAIVPSVLEQKLFGEPIGIVDNYISVDDNNVAEFFGPIASRYSYTPELRGRITEVYQARMNQSMNQYFVLDGSICIAAQSTLKGALQYMNPRTVLVMVG